MPTQTSTAKNAASVRLRHTAAVITPSRMAACEEPTPRTNPCHNSRLVVNISRPVSRPFTAWVNTMGLSAIRTLKATATRVSHRCSTQRANTAIANAVRIAPATRTYTNVCPDTASTGVMTIAHSG